MGVTFIRTIILFVVVVIAMRIMGKRQIGELQASELVVTILISELAAIPMQNLGIPILHGIIPIFTLVICELVLSVITLKNAKIRGLMTGRPVIIIQNGIINQKELKQLRFSVDDLMEEMRLCGVCDFEDVGFAIIETNGKLSVFKNSAKQPPTKEELKLPPSDMQVPIPLILDGRLISRNFDQAKVSKATIMKNIKKQNIKKVEDVFLMYKNSSNQLSIIAKEN